MAPNQVRRTREVLGLTQKDLAQAIAVSRQSLNAIEAGRSLPSVALALKLARTLSSDVETLFGSAEGELIEAALAGSAPRPGARVSVGSVRERWVAHPLGAGGFAEGLQAADGFVRRAPRRGLAQIELARPEAELRASLFIGGCAPGLGVLCDRLNDARGPGRFRWLTQANNVALRELMRGHSHLAGVHLPKRAQRGVDPALSRFLPGERASVFALADWEAGLVVARGNPKRIRDAQALAQPKLRFALREQGSGAHNQLERLLKPAGLSAAKVASRAVFVKSHVEVASAVQLGAADVGFAIRAVAQALELDFVPLVEERFDLVVPGDLANDSRVQRLLDTLSSAWFRRELSELGYDSSCSGARSGELSSG
jgi:molybdate-binding protein/DNA-binding XRE family transcriptional regulator